ncbi:hypothetical protein BGW38_000403, partial [Lunasporangiospora selenospora]
ALTVLDYLLHVGSENVVRYARDNLYIVKTLKEFQFIDEDGKDQGLNVRQKAKDITALLSDEARLRDERRSRSAMHDRMSGRAPGDDRYPNSTTPTYERPGVGDDDRDLQRALEESRRMARDSERSNSEDDDLKKALELSKKEEQERQKNVEKYNELSLTEDWEGQTKANEPKQPQNDTNSVDFFGNDFGSFANNNNNNNGFGTNGFGDNNGFLQMQPTGMNNPYLQFQQQQLQQQQLEQQQLAMQQQLQQQQLQQQQLIQQQQQQQQMAYLNSMGNPYQQQQLMPQMTGAPSIGSNNPFSAENIQKAAANQPFPDSFRTHGFGSNNNGNGFGNNMNGFGNNNNNNNNTNGLHIKSSTLDELSFLQSSMSNSPAISAPAAIQAQPTPVTKAPNAFDEKYSHLAMALSNRDDGADTFGNIGQTRLPSHHTFNPPVTGAANPFQRPNMMGGANNAMGNAGGNNPFQMNNGAAGAGGAYSNNTLF